MDTILIDRLAQEIRRVDGSNSLGAAALAEALMPFLAAQALQAAPEGGEAVAWLWLLNGKPMNVFLHRPDVEADHWTAKGFSVAPLYASPAQPSGFVLVPVEPTEEFRRIFGFMGLSGFSACYAEMLTAAQSAPSPSAALQAGEV